MDADRIVVRQLPNVRAVIVGDVNFLVPAARGDESNLASGESFAAGERFYDVIGELMRIRVWTAVVSFGKHRAAAVIDHLSLQAAAFRRSPHDEGSARAAETDLAGKREIFLYSACGSSAVIPAQTRHVHANAIALADRNRRNVRGKESYTR